MKIMRFLVCILGACATEVLFADSGTWTASNGGNWSETGNWQNGMVASGSGSTAYLTAGSGTITNDQANLALAGLQFLGGSYLLSGNAITLDAAGFVSAAGTQTVAAAVALQGDLALTAASNQVLTVSGAVSGNGTLMINGGSVKLLNTANAYTGQTVLQTGLLEVASVGSLGGNASPVILGRGTFRYAGTGPGDLAQGYTVSNGGTNATTVLDVQTNLTISGKVDAPSTGGGRVVKIGPGTLTYTYPGYQVLNRGGSGSTADANLTIDAVNGGAGTQGYQDFTVAQGKIVFNTAGQTNRFYGQALVGTRYPAAAQMEIDAGTVQNPDTWFSISRGNGDTNNPYSSGLTVNGGRLETSGFVMGYSAGMPGFMSYPTLTQTGGDIVIANDAYMPENSPAVATINITGGTLTLNGLNQGFDLSRGGAAGTVMNVSGGAVVSLAKLRVNTGGTLTISNGSTLALRSTWSSSSGSVYFDNANLTTYAPQGQPSEWFHNTSKLYVKSGGLTASVPDGQYAFLATPPAADPASPGGSLVKSGNGTLALYNTEIPVSVNAGTLRLMDAHVTTNKIAKTISVAAGAFLELAAPHVAETDTLALAGTTGLNLTVPDWAARTELWKVNGSAIARTDGALELAIASGAGVGSAIMTRPVSTTNAWQASFSVAAVAGRTSGYQGDGVAFVIQNDARGTSAYSTNVLTGGFGYAGGAAPVANSFAVALDITNLRLRFGTNGVFTSATYDLSRLSGLGADMDKTFFTIAYDGAGIVTCAIMRKGLQTTAYSFPANLQTLTGATLAYLGFTAGNTSSRYEEHLVRDVTFANGASAASKSFVQYGGNLSLAAGQALDVAINPTSAQNGFGLGTLAYANGSVLNVSQPTAAPPTPAPDLNDRGMWKLNGKAFWNTDGRLAISSNAVGAAGSAYCTNIYAVTGSWMTHFSYDIGITSAPPADGFSFTLQNRGPSDANNFLTGGLNPAFSIGWRFYDGTIRTTSIRMTTNDVQQVTSYDISPVDLVKNGPADITIVYDAPTKVVTVTTIQATGTNITFYTGVDIPAVLGSLNAYVGFTAYVGGSFSQNLISDFSFTLASGSSSASLPRGYLAVGAASGSGTLVKQGNAALGIQDGPYNGFSNATVRLDAGGLALRKFVSEPVTLGDDFYLSRWASWAPGGALQAMYSLGSLAGNGVTAKRHYIAGAWTARYTFFTGARSSSPADGFSFFIHNDSRGPSALGGNTGGSGYTGIANSIALGWNYYEGNNISNTVNYGENGSWLTATRRSNLPIKITTIQLETDMQVHYDPTAQTLALGMWQGTNVFQTVFSNVNIQAKLGGDYGYIGFGAGGGGQYCEARVKDFSFTLDAPTNPLPVTACLGTAILPAGSSNTVSLATVVPHAAFAVGAVQMGDGATLGLESLEANGGSLSVGQAALSGDAAFVVGSGTTLTLTNMVDGVTVTKGGLGTLLLSGTSATYRGATVLQAGTLRLSSPVLPRTTDLVVTNGATLNLTFSGKQYIHSLYVDGVQMHGGRYTSANTTWITGDGILVVTSPPVGTIFFLN